MHPQKSRVSMQGYSTKVGSDSEIPGQKRQPSSAAVSHLWLQTSEHHWSNKKLTAFHTLLFQCNSLQNSVLFTRPSGTRRWRWGTQAPLGTPKDPCPPAARGDPLPEGPGHSDHLLGISRTCDSLLGRTSRGCRTRLCRDPPYLALVEQRLLGLGGLDGQVRLPLLQQVLRHQRDPPPRPAGGTTRWDPGDTLVTARSPRAAPSSQMAADPAVPAPSPPVPHSLLQLRHLAAPPRMRGAEVGPRLLPWEAAPLRRRSPLPGWRSAGNCLARGKGRASGPPCALPAAPTHGQPGRGAVGRAGHPQVVPQPHARFWMVLLGLCSWRAPSVRDRGGTCVCLSVCMSARREIISVYTDRSVLSPAGRSSLAARFSRAGVSLLASAVPPTFTAL